MQHSSCVGFVEKFATAAFKGALPAAIIMSERDFVTVATQYPSISMCDRRGDSETAVEFSTKPK